MVHKMICVAFALLVCVVVVSADEYRGKIKSIDADKGVITLTIGDKDQEFKVPASAKITAGKKDVQDGIKNKKFSKSLGSEATVITEKKDGAETVTEIRLQKKGK